MFILEIYDNRAISEFPKVRTAFLKNVKSFIGERMIFLEAKHLKFWIVFGDNND